MSKIDHSLFKANAHALEQIDDLCPKCGADLKIKHGKSGAFIGCADYPTCDYSKPLHEYESAVIKTIEGSSCPLCQASLVIKKGPYGLYIGCSDFPQCHYVESSTESQAKNKDVSVSCPSCHSGHLVKRANKFGKQFYPCDKYPKCKYVVNFKPVKSSCPLCHWPIMLEKKSAKGRIHQCPQRLCGHKVVQSEAD